MIGAAGGQRDGSLALLPLSVGDGLTEAGLRPAARLRARHRLPVVIQGIGWRPGMDAQWERDQAFLDASTRDGAAIYGLYRNHPMVRPFNFRAALRCSRASSTGGTSRDVRADGSPIRDDHRPMAGAPRRLAGPPDHRSGPGRDDAAAADGHRLRRRVASDATRVGKVDRPARAGAGTHPPDVICDLLDADELGTGFEWRSETAEWRRGTADTLRHPNILIGTGDGGAHADRDDGSEWSTYFLSSWVRDQELFTLEEGVRRITSVPAQICGLDDRGMIAPGFGADIVLLDLERSRARGQSRSSTTCLRMENAGGPRSRESRWCW